MKKKKIYFCQHYDSWTLQLPQTLDPDTECDACDVGRPARKKCIECTDWLCNQCCSMHLKVWFKKWSYKKFKKFYYHNGTSLEHKVTKTPEGDVIVSPHK